MKVTSKLLTIFVLSIVALTLANIFSTSFVLKQLQDKRLKTTEAIYLSSLAKRVVKAVSEKQPYELEEILFQEKSLATAKIEYFFVVDDANELLTSTFVSKFPKVLLNLKRNFLKDETCKIIKIVNKELSVYDIAVPVFEDTNNVGTIHIGIKKKYVDDVITPIKKTSFFILVVSGLCSFLGIFIFWFMLKSILNSIEQLKQLSEKVSKGELEVESHIHSKDELGHLGLAFNAMIKNLRELLKKTISAVQQITITSNELTDSSQGQAAGVQEQSSSIAETTSAAKELCKSAEMVGENIQKVIEVTDHALTGMAGIKESIAITAGKVTSLSENSKKIGVITHLIDDVADKTNLLAINAAIEAARAGEQGMGFTVVADEIRKLSDSTAKSTKEINALIEIIQNEISNAIISMEENVNSVNEELELSKESAKRAKEISMSATQQISGARQISEAMVGIDIAMKQTSSGATQSEEAARQLKKLADELTQLAGTFRIKSSS